ncbi:MAG: uroporphyrinogen decarboxylase family protein [Bacillota bacterium]
MKDSLTSRERWQAVLDKEKKPDRIPLDYRGTSEVNNMLKKYLKCNTMEEIYNKLHLDVPVNIAPEYVGPSLPENTDIYGCIYKDVSYNTGVYRECVSHPLAGYNSVDEIEKNYRWPSVDWYDYYNIPKQIRGKEDRPICGGGSEPFLIYKNLRGDEQAFIDLELNPSLVNYCLDHLYEFCYKNTQRIYEQIPGEVMLTHVAEDMGSENNLMYSPEQIKKFFIPRMKKMIELVHDEGAYVIHHSDGAIRKIIPDMIEAGIDILDPVQWRCKGMEREALKRDFGDELIFHGAMDNQITLAFGSKTDVEKEVLENLNIFGKDGGYILAPCHNIQPITSPEIIATMYVTAYNNSKI